jgi:acetyl-CoA acetyltransferase
MTSFSAALADRRARRQLPRIAVLNAGYAQTVAGVQVERFCASGLEACNIAAAKVKSGEAELAIGGGCESMSRVPMGSTAVHGRRTRSIAMKILLHAARRRRRHDRHQVRLLARPISTATLCNRNNAPRKPGKKAASRNRSSR